MKNNLLKSLLALVVFFVFPFYKKALFAKNELMGSVRHDLRLFIIISAFTIISVVLSIFLWITLGAGIIIYLVFGSGAILTVWLYILLFQILTILTLALASLVLKRFFATPKTAKKVKDLF